MLISRITVKIDDQKSENFAKGVPLDGNFGDFDGRFSLCCVKSTPTFFRQKTLIFSPSLRTKNFDPYSFSPTPTFLTIKIWNFSILDFRILKISMVDFHHDAENQPPHFFVKKRSLSALVCAQKISTPTHFHQHRLFYPSKSLNFKISIFGFFEILDLKIWNFRFEKILKFFPKFPNF